MQKTISDFRVVVRGTCKCCGTSFQEIVDVGSPSSVAVPAKMKVTGSADPFLAEVVNAVAEGTAVPIGILLSKDRTDGVALARHLAVWVLHVRVAIPLKQCAKVVGYDDHTSALYGVQRIDGLLGTWNLDQVGLDWFTQEPCRPRTLNREALIRDVRSIYNLLSGA